MPRSKDPYLLHRTALRPLLPNVAPSALEQAWDNVASIGEDRFIHFLLAQGLGPSWDEFINRCPTVCQFSKSNLAILHNSRLTATADYLLQKNCLDQTSQILVAANIRHAVIKGLHTRERYFPRPALRVAVDQDVLIVPRDRVKAIRAFQKEGFTFRGVPENISHECSLINGKRNIDLHWDVLRPGRTRMPMAPRILGTTMDYGSHWGPDDNATLYLLLVHSVFAKYLTTPHASLIRLLDLAYVLEKSEIDWDVVLDWLYNSGLKTAAWLTFTWFQILTNISISDFVYSELKPGHIKTRYLESWLNNDLSSRWQDNNLLMQLGFTLIAHDQVADSWRAAFAARSCRKSGPEMLESLGEELTLVAASNMKT